MATGRWARRIIRWYESESLLYSAVGAWAKFAYEYVTAAVPLAIIVFGLAAVVPGLEFALSFAPPSALVVWLSLSLTVTGIRWCFLRAGVSDDS